MKILWRNRKLIIKNCTIDIVGILFNRWTLLFAFFVMAAILLAMVKSSSDNVFIDSNVYYSIATISLLYTAVIASYDFQIRRNERKIDKAMELVEKFDSPDLRRVRDFTRVIGKHMPNIPEKEELQKKKKKYGYPYNKENINMERDLVFLFNFWQQVYLSIEKGIADEKYICHNLKKVFDSQYKRFNFWIVKHLKDGDPKQYNDLKKFNDLDK